MRNLRRFIICAICTYIPLVLSAQTTVQNDVPESLKPYLLSKPLPSVFHVPSQNTQRSNHLSVVERKYTPASPDETLPLANISGKNLVTPTNNSPLLQNQSGNKPLAVTPPGFNIGYTYYDFQTNSCMADRIAYTTDPSDPNAKYVFMFWMASTDSTRGGAAFPLTPGYNDTRGSYYAGLDVSKPDAPVDAVGSWAKPEKTIAGWPSIILYSNGAIGTTSHSPVTYYGGTNFGDDPSGFVKYPVSAGTSTWPRSVADGKDNVHAIYTYPTATPAGTKDNDVFYSRSINKGKTWSAEKRFTGAAFEGTTYPKGEGGDTYAIAAKANVVATACLDQSLTLRARTSTDYGVTWTKPIIIWRAQETYIDTVDVGGGNVIMHSDTVSGPGSQIDIIIDSKGAVNYVFNEVLMYVTTSGVRVGKDSVTLGSGLISDLEDQNSYAANKLGMLFYHSGDTVLTRIAPPCGGETWNGKGYIVSRRRFSGFSRFPQLGLDANDTPYLVYTSVKNNDYVSMPMERPKTTAATGVADTTVDGLYGHIYATHQLSPGVWSYPKDIIQKTGIDCLYGTLCNTVTNGRMYIGYSADNTPGDRVTNTELPMEQTQIYMYAFPTSLLNQSPTSVEEIPAVQSDNFRLSASPNPSNGTTTFSFFMPKPDNVKVELFNMLGMKVATIFNSFASIGENTTSFDASNLPTGAYFATLTSQGQKSNTMITIVR